MKKLIFILALILVGWAEPAQCVSNCATVTTTDIQSNCVVEITTTCCNGLPAGSIECIVTTRIIFCTPIIN